MKKILMLGAAFLALLALPALAEDGAAHKGPRDGGKHLEKMFMEQDTNKDGALSEDEAVAFAKKRFGDTDADKDGKVTKDEVKAHMDAKRAEWKEKREAMKKDAPKEAPAGE